MTARFGSLPERGLWVAIGERPWIGLAVAVAIVLLDQWTKQVAVSTLSFREPVAVTSWFDWMLTYNTGAAFSFLAEAGGWQRWFLAGVALVVISQSCSGRPRRTSRTAPPTRYASYPAAFRV